MHEAVQLASASSQIPHPGHDLVDFVDVEADRLVAAAF
jgi:hypothetical protein